jgi:hypothetical protein
MSRYRSCTSVKRRLSETTLTKWPWVDARFPYLEALQPTRIQRSDWLAEVAEGFGVIQV